jgi:hypothetical protein
MPTHVRRTTQFPIYYICRTQFATRSAPPESLGIFRTYMMSNPPQKRISWQSWRVEHHPLILDAGVTGWPGSGRCPRRRSGSVLYREYQSRAWRSRAYVAFGFHIRVDAQGSAGACYESSHHFRGTARGIRSMLRQVGLPAGLLAACAVIVLLALEKRSLEAENDGLRRLSEWPYSGALLHKHDARRGDRRGRSAVSRDAPDPRLFHDDLSLLPRERAGMAFDRGSGRR